MRRVLFIRIPREYSGGRENTLWGDLLENVPLLLGMNFVDIYKFIDDGIYRESARAMDLKLLGNIASVGN